MSLVFQSTKNVKEAQIIQLKKDKMIVRIVTEELFSQSDFNYLMNQLKARLGNTMSIDITRVNKIERTNIGKYKFIISEI